MSIEQKMKLYKRLLEITAESRFTLMKELWNWKANNREIISRTLTQMRNTIFLTVTSERLRPFHPSIDEIIKDDILPQIQKNIRILAIYGLEAECIADLNCVNVGYVRICIRSLKKDFPEIFG